MSEGSENIGFDVICRAFKCKHNDAPVCEIHSPKEPMIVGFDGQCVKYDEKEEGESGE